MKYILKNYHKNCMLRNKRRIVKAVKCKSTYKTHIT